MIDISLLSGFPGASVALKDRYGKTHFDCCGFSDVESDTKVTEETIFPACSISKLVTAMCVMKLEKQGLLELDENVNSYLNSWKLRDSSGKEANVSLRELLSHTAGIVDGEDGFYGHRLDDEEISLMDILEGKTSYNCRPARVETVPGTVFEYSDAGFCIIQLVLEEVTDKKFDVLASELVLMPLGMKHSFFGTREQLVGAEGRLATGYHASWKPLSGGVPVCPDLAASALWSTPGDLLLLAEEVYREYISNNYYVLLDGPKAFPWTGLGVFKDERHAISKGWGENGQCMLKLDLKTGAACAVMTNMDPEAGQEESGIEELVNQLIKSK